MNTTTLDIRKLYTIVSEDFIEGEKKLDNPVRKAVAVAVIKNPYVNMKTENLNTLYTIGEKLGGILGESALKALGVTQQESQKEIESYGKAVIVGEDGQLEHGHAIIHPRFGGPFREILGGAKYCRAVIPSNSKIGTLGTKIDVPLHYKDSEWVASHYDTMEVYVPDSPRKDEFLIAVAIADSGRPLARIKGITKQDIE